MPENKNQFPMPSSPVAQVGQPPEAGQWCRYVAKDGQVTPALVSGVYPKPPEDKDYPITALRLKPAEGRLACPHEYNGWKYAPAGIVVAGVLISPAIYWDPCVPPGMQDPDAAQEPDGDKDDR